MAAEIERARRIQTDLLPSSTPPVDGLELAQRIEFLGEMGGDYYDYIPFGDGRLGIVCGDVMGKGLAAALIMAMARSLLHDAIAPGKRPGEVLAEVNDGLARDLEGQRLPYFLTLALAVFDPADRTLVDRRRRPQPRARRRRAGRARKCRPGARPSAYAPVSSSPRTSQRCGPGDDLALYTDGLTEARDPGRRAVRPRPARDARSTRVRTSAFDDALEGVVGRHRRLPRRRRARPTTRRSCSARLT